MISLTEKQTLLAGSSKLQDAITTFKALVAANGLPITSDFNTLTTALKGQLFQKLLAVDKGLKMRFDLLKTDDAKIKLLNETVNLDGYTEVVEMQEELIKIERLYNQLAVGFLQIHKAIPFKVFVERWEMNVDNVLSAMLFDFSDKEHVLDFINSIIPTLTTLRECFRATFSTDYNLEETLNLLGSMYTSESNKGTIAASEGAVMQIAKHLEESSALQLIPQAK